MKIEEIQKLLESDRNLREAAILCSAGILLSEQSGVTVIRTSFNQRQAEELWDKLIGSGIVLRVGDDLYQIIPGLRDQLLIALAMSQNEWRRSHEVFARDALKRGEVYCRPQSGADSYWHRQATFSMAYHQMLSGDITDGFRVMIEFARSENYSIRRAFVSDLRRLLPGFRILGESIVDRMLGLIHMAENPTREEPVRTNSNSIFRK